MAAPLSGLQEMSGLPPMDTQQVQMMRLLAVNKERLNENEKQLLRELEQRDRECQVSLMAELLPHPSF